jgi:hypothetical protein
MKKETKPITVASAFPDHYEIYEDGSMKAWCKRCNNPEEIDAERAAKIQKIPDWSSSFTCTPCWRKSKEPDSKDKTDQIEWGQAYNLAFSEAQKQQDISAGGFFENVEIHHAKILAHIKEFKQKTLNH